jgi:hypothetical protein
MPTKTELEAENTRLRAELQAARDNSDQTVKELKERTLEVARRAQDQYGWCSEIDRALAEAGITPTLCYSGTVLLRLKINRMELNPDHIDVSADLSDIARDLARAFEYDIHHNQFYLSDIAESEDIRIEQVRFIGLKPVTN